MRCGHWDASRPRTALVRLAPWWSADQKQLCLICSACGAACSRPRGLASERPRLATASHALRPLGREPAADGARKSRAVGGSRTEATESDLQRLRRCVFAAPRARVRTAETLDWVACAAATGTRAGRERRS